MIALKYEMTIRRKEAGRIEWAIKFADNESDTDQELTIDVVKNFFDALYKLEQKNGRPDNEYHHLTTFQKWMLLRGDCLAGSLVV